MKHLLTAGPCPQAANLKFATCFAGCAADAPPCCDRLTVGPGASISSTASDVNLPPATVAAYNQLAQDATLQQGQSLSVPCGRILVLIAAQLGTGSSGSSVGSSGMASSEADIFWRSTDQCRGCDIDTIYWPGISEVTSPCRSVCSAIWCHHRYADSEWNRQDRPRHVCLRCLTGAPLALLARIKM